MPLRPSHVLLSLCGVLAALALQGCQQRTGADGGTGLVEPLGSVPGADSGARIHPSQVEMVSLPGYIVKDTPRPVYPADALAAHAGERTVYVAVRFDEAGRVVEVNRLLRGDCIEDQYTDEFYAAARAAAMQWTVSPPRQAYYERKSDGIRRLVRTVPVAGVFDVKFTFEASGRVD